MSIKLDRGVTEVTHELKNPLESRKAYTSPWILRTENPGEVVLTQVGGTLNRQPTENFILAEVKDIYKGSSVDSKYYPSSLKAAKAVFTSKEIWSIMQSTNSSSEANVAERHFPITASVTLTIPTALPLNETDVVSGDAVKESVQQFVDTVLGTAAERIIEQLYGALDARQDELKSTT
jgi:hypothetical protein